MKKLENIKFLLPLLLVLSFAGCVPVVTITSPKDGDVFIVGEEITFSGTATDSTTGSLPDEALIWTSDRDGEIGQGGTFTSSDLSEGVHKITLSATNNAGDTGSATIQITVGNGTPSTTTISGATTTTPDTLERWEGHSTLDYDPPPGFDMNTCVMCRYQAQHVYASWIVEEDPAGDPADECRSEITAIKHKKYKIVSGNATFTTNDYLSCGKCSYTVEPKSQEIELTPDKFEWFTFCLGLNDTINVSAQLKNGFPTWQESHVCPNGDSGSGVSDSGFQFFPTWPQCADARQNYTGGDTIDFECTDICSKKLTWHFERKKQ